MRFRWNGSEFDGPSIKRGMLAPYTVGELRWAKKALKVARIEDLDAAEAQILYFVLAIRRTDHTLLPIERFEDLTVADFDAVEHAPALDAKGLCDECGAPADAPVHEGFEPVPTVAGATR